MQLRWRTDEFGTTAASFDSDTNNCLVVDNSFSVHTLCSAKTFATKEESKFSSSSVTSLFDLVSMPIEATTLAATELQEEIASVAKELAAEKNNAEKRIGKIVRNARLSAGKNWKIEKTILILEGISSRRCMPCGPGATRPCRTK